MKGGIIWLAVSYLMALALLLASCAPAAPTPSAPTPAAPTPTAPAPAAPAAPAPEAAGPEMVQLTLTKLDGTKVEKSLEKPRYGGILNIFGDPRATYPDPVAINPGQVLGSYVYASLLDGSDYARGPIGTGEFFYDTALVTISTFAGDLAEGWELSDDTIAYHLRKGVRYSFDPTNEASLLVNGREMVADDVVFYIKRYFDMLPEYPTPEASGVQRLAPEERPISVTAPDKYTVVLKVDPTAGPGNLFRLMQSATMIYPPELVAKYKNLRDWKVGLGAGPWIKGDYVPGVSYTLLRNPTYYGKDPLTGMQAPYVDSVKLLTVVDSSTQQAAIRTGKIDYMSQLNLETVKALANTAPNLQMNTARYRQEFILNYRVDKPELPTYDIKVRQALQLAVDRQSILKDYYDGVGTIYSFPVVDSPDWRSVGSFMPLEELPSNVQELFQYKPDKARQLLAEAGYPNGFNMEVLTMTDGVDALSILKFYFEQVGIKLDIQVRDRGVFTSTVSNTNHKFATFMQKNVKAITFDELRPTNHDRSGNHSMIDDAKTNDYIVEFSKYYFQDDAKAFKIMKDFTPYQLEQAWVFAFPVGDGGSVWWPWLKNYQGQSSPQFHYLWIDLQLKKSMGY